MKTSKTKKDKVKKTKSNDATIPEKELRYNSKIAGTEYLSQFASIPVCLYYMRGDTRVWLEFSNAEAAFQYFKTKSPLYREKIISCVLASKARYFGSAKSECPLRSDWDEIKDTVMLRVLWAKFSQNNIYGERLLSTDDLTLIEHAPWDKEGYWGESAPGEGKNQSGKTLEKVRTRLRKAKPFNAESSLYDMTKFI